MVSISLCMIVKNEEAVLARCLDCVKDIVDEINIVDTGSTDRTIEIANEYTDRIFHHEWSGFAPARNESFKHATKEYILYLDADDILLEEDQKKLKDLKETLDPSVDSVSMFYNAGTDEFGNVTLRYRRNRLVKTSKNYRWEGDVHNYLNVSGKIINSDISITHKKIGHSVGRNLTIYQMKIDRGDVFGARDYFYYGNELRENGHYEQAIEAYTKNIEMKEGWIEDKVYACINRGDCYRFLGDLNNELKSLFQSFVFSKTPRAETCSRIGYNFQRKKEFQSAIYWYTLATQLVPDENRWSFSYPAYYTWYPHLQMCVCYDRLGETEKAFYHNEEAGKYRPDDPSILSNKAYFEKKLGPSNK
ncbi:MULTISPECIES: glycosyltransferase [Metabacillus]|uniref:Glycosyltransferase n=1 Tax=Metabacillus hrfriensis TaxID=3048891 RepID=A0ACD4R5E7_9BACI|nr:MULTISPECIES: glycosyltransferase [Metabacillus]UAL50194.1 glycosyltransferase [Metabacillus dongyingensis]WHZ55661.1 glycosyltransferase [Metabacillus sp. CT-WN-B3]